MDNLSKEDIDYIFKEGAKREEFPFKESSWDNMESMLDAQENKRALYWKSGLALALAILLSVGVYFYSNADNSTKALETNAPIIANSTIDVNNEPFSSTINTQTNNNLLKENITSATNESILTKALTPKNTKTSIPGSITSKTKTNTAGPLSPHLNTEYSKNPSEYGFRYDRESVIAPSPSPFSDEQNEVLHKQELTSNQNIKNEAPKLNRIKLINAIPRLALLTFNSPSEPIESKLLEFDKPSTNRLSYRFMLGKEWSSVGAMNKTTGGFKLGAEVAYQFNSKFQISTGFGVSLKKYETEGINTTGLQARIAWADDVPPETVLGKCTVLEIPFDFNYYLKGYKRNGFFVGGGLNTYLMASEWYDFKFDAQYASQNDLYWTTQDRNMKMRNHFFSIVSAQVGYQHQFSDKLALQVAPYIQIPLTGIGMGDVNLVSTGVQVKLAFAK